jgi:hypothetical protein
MVTLMLSYKFFKICSNELQTFLREKVNLSLEEMLEQAKYYIEVQQDEFKKKKRNEEVHGRGEAKSKVHNKQTFHCDATSDKFEPEKQGRPGAKSSHLCESDKNSMGNCNS